MDRITPTVIGVFLVGIALGYLIHSGISKTPTVSEQAENVSTSSPPSGSNEAKIQDALAAAPESLRGEATVLDYPEKEGGEMPELKKGTNDWTCMPDYPASPGKDPMCVDKMGMTWLMAYVSQQTPVISQNGIAYMLQGGSDASNTDPFATKPTEGEDWITTSAHMMVLPSQKLDANVYGTDPKKGGPWIMWVNTPYEHLMVPVQ